MWNRYDIVSIINNIIDFFLIKADGKNMQKYNIMFNPNIKRVETNSCERVASWVLGNKIVSIKYIYYTRLYD